MIVDFGVPDNRINEKNSDVPSFWYAKCEYWDTTGEMHMAF
jgi:hypothetical protein